MMKHKICVCVLLSLFFGLRSILGEEYNLFGDAGQAYSIEVNLGHPHQKLNVIVDTGSTTLAIASAPRIDSKIYFHSQNSSSIYDTGTEVQAKYSQGMWVGRLVSDFIRFPSLPNVPEVRSDMALITKSHKFFMNGSGWQGLLGLAYLPVGARGDNVIVESWLDSLEHTLNQPASFQLKLCGAKSPYNATHYGNFKMLNDNTLNNNPNRTFYTPILLKRWYEVGVLSIRVLSTNPLVETTVKPNNISEKLEEPNEESCRMLNKEKSIVDSGTTNIRLPDLLFRQIVDQLKNEVHAANVLILDEFWYHGEAACWPEPQEWQLPWLAVDLLSTESDFQYFTLEIPPQNYMRVMTAHNSSSEGGTVSEFCYKLGLEAGGRETVLGYTAMEGFEVLFNRSAGWIGWQTSNCGANARITGPYNTSTSLLTRCQLSQPIPDTATSIKAAQWALCVVSIIAGGVLIYLLAPCVKLLLVRRLPLSQQISLSQAALVEQESS